MMSMQAITEPTMTRTIESPQDTRSGQTDEKALGVIQRLKDDFGDYSDPMTYDWTWRETD